MEGWGARGWPSSTISDDIVPSVEVLHIAVRMAHGHSAALVPAVLASIYSDLSALHRHFIYSKRTDVPSVSAPMHILSAAGGWARLEDPPVWDQPVVGDVEEGNVLQAELHECRRGRRDHGLQLRPRIPTREDHVVQIELGQPRNPAKPAGGAGIVQQHSSRSASVAGSQWKRDRSGTMSWESARVSERGLFPATARTHSSARWHTLSGTPQMLMMLLRGRRSARGSVQRRPMRRHRRGLGPWAPAALGLGALPRASPSDGGGGDGKRPGGIH